MTSAKLPTEYTTGSVDAGNWFLCQTSAIMTGSGSDSAKLDKMTELNLKQRKMIELEQTHPYSISHNEKSGLWKTQVGKGKGDRKQITAKTKPELLEKLLDYYHTGMGFEQMLTDWLSMRVRTGEIVQTTANNILYRARSLSSQV